MSVCRLSLSVFLCLSYFGTKFILNVEHNVILIKDVVLHLTIRFGKVVLSSPPTCSCTFSQFSGLNRSIRFNPINLLTLTVNRRCGQAGADGFAIRPHVGSHYYISLLCSKQCGEKLNLASTASLPLSAQRPLHFREL